MKRMLIAAVSLLALSGFEAARAESNDLAAVERPATTGVVLSAPSRAGGSEAYPDFAAAQSVPVTAGGVLATNGSEGPVQSANSLPVGFANGTPAYEYAQSVQRAFAARMERGRLAGVAHGQHPG